MAMHTQSTQPATAGAKTLDLTARGIAIFIGPLEAAVMRAVWAGCRSSRNIYNHVRRSYAAARTDDIAFTTITTTLTRLTARGLLARSGDKMHYVFSSAAPSEAAFIAENITAALAALFEAYPRETGAAIVAIVKRNKSNAE